MRHFRKILEFEQLLKEFNSIYRDLESIHDRYGKDNNAEHSYRVAMLSWMIAEEYGLKLNIGKVLAYALIHDFVEVYAGDLSIYKNYDQKVKEHNEHKALLKLKKKYPKLKRIWKLIAVYEKRKDAESKFVYVMEKLEPILVVILSGQKHWKKRKVSMEDFSERKLRKIRPVDTPAQIFTRDIFAYLKKNRKKFF